ncbi:hypothetical protein RUM43_000510 [Polyplax serrata]|uniref:RAP domain-containing protein n=1 Tax=Polyplax serrata TaxID=468196 RepID=A0AAN8XN82_POLSC
MIRLSRSFLWRAKEFSNVQHIGRRASQIQCYSEYVQPKEAIPDNTDVSSKTAAANLPNESENIPQSKYLSADTFQKAIESSKLYSERECIELSNSLEVTKAAELVKVISQTKSRPIKLLRPLVSKIASSKETLNLLVCSNLLYSLSCLSYRDKCILDKIANDILSKKKTFTNGSLPASILQSCGVLKYRNCELIDTLLHAILYSSSPKRIEGLLAGLMTLSIVNYFPKYGTLILNELLNCKSTDFSQTKAYVDFTWACILLDQPLAQHISCVLSESFINKLEVVLEYSGQQETVNKKILQINAAAQLLLKSYNGPTLEKVRCRLLNSKSKTQFLASVVDGLSHIFPKYGYLATSVDTGSGFLLDVECVLDSKGNPLPLKRRKDGIRIAIMLIGYNDLCLDEQNTEIGPIVFQQRILEAKGFKVVKVIYSEYDELLKLCDKVDYLRKKLQTITAATFESTN